jgi:beta-ribofuranosylaminobenzene 5'-phosphate synthase
MQVTVKTPSRLHCTLIDLHGGLGRVDGGIGVALEDPKLMLRAHLSDEPSNVRGINKDLFQKFVNQFLKNSIEVLAIEPPGFEVLGAQINVLETIPSHMGLGSRTQLSLALGVALTRLLELDCSIQTIARVMGRGGTSGVGVAAFEQGGFILDVGHSFGPGRQKTSFVPSRIANAPPAPVLAHQAMPPDWLFVVTLPAIGKGAYGSREVEIFRKYCPIPKKEVEKLSRLILMQLMPALIEKDIQTFGAALTALQQIGFKKVEINLQRKIITDLMEVALSSGAAGGGMSSFGPATYALVTGREEAEDVARAMRRTLQDEKVAGQVFISRPNNVGALVEVKK